MNTVKYYFFIMTHWIMIVVLFLLLIITIPCKLVVTLHLTAIDQVDRYWYFMTDVKPKRKLTVWACFVKNWKN